MRIWTEHWKRSSSIENLLRHWGEKLNASLKLNGRKKIIINFSVWLTIVTNGTLIYDSVFYSLLKKFIVSHHGRGTESEIERLKQAFQHRKHFRPVQRSHLFSWLVSVCFILSPVVFQFAFTVYPIVINTQMLVESKHKQHWLSKMRCNAAAAASVN